MNAQAPSSKGDYGTMIPEEEIQSNIKEMGYITATPRAIYPSYYKLNDSTVLKVVVNVNYLLPDPRQPEGYSVNASNIFSAFVPKEKRKPQAFRPYNPAELANNIIDEDVEFEVLRENFSVYDLSNGMVLSLKPVTGQVKKTSLYDVGGEPIYIVTVNSVIKIKKQ